MIHLAFLSNKYANYEAENQENGVQGVSTIVGIEILRFGIMGYGRLSSAHNQRLIVPDRVQDLH